MESGFCPIAFTWAPVDQVKEDGRPYLHSVTCSYHCCGFHRGLCHVLCTYSTLTPEAEQAVKSLEEQLQCEPRFSQALKDRTQPQGATVQLTCHIEGTVYPFQHISDHRGFPLL